MENVLKHYWKFSQYAVDREMKLHDLARQVRELTEIVVELRDAVAAQ